MKKKVIISTFAIATMALTAFTGYKTFGPKKSTSDLLLDENIEALTKGEDSNCDYRLFPCAKTSGTECMASPNTMREKCCTVTYCYKS